MKVSYEFFFRKFGVSEISSFQQEIIAITVSVNYEDYLSHIIPRNINIFDYWIIVTDPHDLKTQQLLAKYPKIINLFFKFETRFRVFNKGGAIRKAQKLAYSRFPNAWFLLLDSDIIIDQSFELIKKNLHELDPTFLFGCQNRLDFKEISAYLNNYKAEVYNHDLQIHGYFQLYKAKKLYNQSFDASKCDLDFAAKFTNKKLLNDFNCYHLGPKGNWQGRNRNTNMESK